MERGFRAMRTRFSPLIFSRNQRLAPWNTAGPQSVLVAPRVSPTKPGHGRPGSGGNRVSKPRHGLADDIVWSNPSCALQCHAVRGMAGLGGERSMNTPKHFVDLSRVRVLGGRGGNGCVSYARDNKTRWGGPDGGQGGDGGSVWVEATTSMQDLSRDRHTYQAGDGVHGKPNRCDGARGKDIVLYVPVGTLVKKMPVIEEGDGKAEAQGEAGMTAITEIINDPTRKKKKSMPKGQTRAKIYKNKAARKEAKKEERLRQAEEEDAEEEGEEEEWEDEEDDWGMEGEEGGKTVAEESGGGKRGKVLRFGPTRYEDEDEQEFVARRMRELKKHPDLEWDGARLNVANVSLDEVQNLIYFGNREGLAHEEEEGELLADLDTEGQRVLVAAGGVGGRGNVALSSKKERAPAEAESGGQGARYRIELELKSIADFGLIGFPNAGKSSLLRAISNAHPKVASYPFTTMRPHIGIVEDADAIDTLSVADLPGLVEGAHDNVGLGHSFLRHVERTRGLVFVIDVRAGTCILIPVWALTSGCEGSMEMRDSDPYKDLQALRRELELYHPSLTRRTSIVLANKMDLPLAEDGLDLLRRGLRTLSAVSPQDALADAPIIPISAQNSLNIDQVVSTLFSVLEAARSVPLNPETGVRYTYT